jgi:hypothetical protein
MKYAGNQQVKPDGFLINQGLWKGLFSSIQELGGE